MSPYTCNPCPRSAHEGGGDAIERMLDHRGGGPIPLARGYGVRYEVHVAVPCAGGPEVGAVVAVH